MSGRTSRRTVLALSVAALAGCPGPIGEVGTSAGKDGPLAGDATELGDLDLTSPAFDDEGPIPREYGRHQRDVNPPLAIAGVPADAGSLILVMDDPDAVEPAGKVWLHWLVWNIDPARERIPEDWDGGGAVEGENDFDERGYGGPAPPDGKHTYRFKLYAADRTLDLPASASRARVGEAIDGHVLARTHLEGTYAP